MLFEPGAYISRLGNYTCSTAAEQLSTTFSPFLLRSPDF